MSVKESDILSIFKKRYNNTYVLYLKDAEVVDYITKQSEICPFVNSIMKITNIVGEGKYGKVYLIDFPESETNRKYVVKVYKNESYSQKNDDGYTLNQLSDVFKELGTELSIPFLDKYGDISNNPLTIPYFVYKILTHTDKKYKTWKDNTIEVPKGSYVSPHGIYSEYLIAMLLSKFIRNFNSIHFIDTIDMSTCYNDKPYSSESYKQYVFMEHIDTSFTKLNSCINKSDIHTFMTLFVQIIHTIGVYQKVYKINHGDLHSDNILIQFITDDMMWKGQHLSKAEYFEYKFDDITLYMPYIPYIAKIADFGLSCKYSEPMIFNKAVLKQDIETDTIPNWYSPSYDVYHVIMECAFGFSNKNIRRLMLKLVYDIFNFDSKQNNAFVNFCKLYSNPEFISRMNMKTAWNHKDTVTVKKVLSSPIFDSYRIKPSSDANIIILGSI